MIKPDLSLEYNYIKLPLNCAVKSTISNAFQLLSVNQNSEF